MRDNDPLLIHGSDSKKMLTQRFGSASDGFMGDDVITAAVNIIVSVVRQAYPSRTAALARMDKLVAETRQAIANQYSVGGQRLQGTYAFDQKIEMPLMNLRDLKNYGVR